MVAAPFWVRKRIPVKPVVSDASTPLTIQFGGGALDEGHTFAVKLEPIARNSIV
jgi:hypothetical protein